MPSQTSIASHALPESTPPAARAVLHLLKSLDHGTLDVQLPDGSAAHFGTHGAGEPRAALRLHNWKVCAAVLRSGDIGFAESYIAGDWTTPDLATLLTLLIANRDRIEKIVYGNWWGALLYRARHLFNRNSRRGSKKNIHAHYDLGNPFYRLWLDPTMNYSSAWFEGDRSADLVEAQWAKVRRALRECDVQPRQRVLEIGCGWGALAECAAREYGATVTGVTFRPSSWHGPKRAWSTPTCLANCACRTTATSPTGHSTPSCRSRCSRPSAASTGPASSMC